MAQDFKIKPAQGMKVRDPETMKPLKTSGETKPRNEYWLRRIADKSVVEIKPKTTSK
ncbi:DUF2635 domain-containing protein [Thiomicrorhabdus sp.]|uniref:DUF2635 domain-containing protein n=1 Tax=Thiomicrorhabdus sp. TaxID=2039724 RepID=UPI003566DE8C